MDLEQFTTHPFSPAQDFPRLVSLYRDVETADQLGTDTSEQSMRQQIELSGHDPLQDRWVVEAPGESGALIASALARLSSSDQAVDANIVVHPAWRRNGIGSSLLSRVVARGCEQHASSVRIYADRRLPAAASFLLKNGFSLQGAYTELRLAQGVRLPPVIWPFGYTMRSYAEVQDMHILTEAMNLSYIPLWGHQEVSEAEMAAWLSDFDQQGLFLVFSEKGRVVGIGRTEPSPERSTKNGMPTGYIDAPGIVPQHRRLDLYRALVLTGIRWLQNQGQTIIEMESWGDKLEVLKMYRELGFKDLRQLVCYALALTKTSGSQDQVSR